MEFSTTEQEKDDTLIQVSVLLKFFTVSCAIT